ncbi:MAG: hypothetical protein IMZ59_02125 [Actinobacteria bacterium]|nr:hypothetical protein [Actinomycetota bacterium]
MKDAEVNFNLGKVYKLSFSQMRLLEEFEKENHIKVMHTTNPTPYFVRQSIIQAPSGSKYDEED